MSALVFNIKLVGKSALQGYFTVTEIIAKSNENGGYIRIDSQLKRC